MALDDFFDDYPHDYFSSIMDAEEQRLAKEQEQAILKHPKSRWLVACHDDYGNVYYQEMPTWSWTKGVMKLKKSEINKFYVSAEHIARAIDAGENDSWTHKTEEDAIAHAQKIIEMGKSRTVVICKIIAIIEKEAPPTKITRL